MTISCAAAMIDRLVHHAFVVALKGDSYGLKKPRRRPLVLWPGKLRRLRLRLQLFAAGSGRSTTRRGSPT